MIGEVGRSSDPKTTPTEQRRTIRNRLIVSLSLPLLFAMVPTDGFLKQACPDPQNVSFSQIDGEPGFSIRRVSCPNGIARTELLIASTSGLKVITSVNSKTPTSETIILYAGKKIYVVVEDNRIKDVRVNNLPG